MARRKASPIAQPSPAAADASRPASDAAPTTSHQPEAAAEIATQAAAVEPGNVPAAPAGGDSASEAARARTRVVDRLCLEKRWNRELSELRDRMIIEAKAGGMTKEQAQLWTYAELDRLYPPIQKGDIVTKLPGGEPAETVETQSTPKLADNRVHGLGELPSGWPDLPPNASLAVEIGWVQAERLRIVEERPGGATLVRLERARSPAPSWSALAWLETSIRSYAKYVEVAAKVASTPGDEQAQIKRERARIADIRAVLAEMLPETGPDPAGPRGDPERISPSP